MMELQFERIEILLFVAAVVAMLARRLRVPYSVGLVAAGTALAFLPVSHQIKLTKDLIYLAFLPPLVFEAALFLRWSELKKDLAVIVTLATAGVVISAGLTAAGMHWLAGWPWIPSLLFGTLIAATDPVSVIATFKDANVHGRLRLLVESESLFNDSTAAVAFGVAMLLASGGSITFAGVASGLALSIAGGLACGAVVAGAVLLLAGRTTDHLVEITFTTLAAYGSFLLAEHFHFSGVMATLTAGLLVGNLGFLGAISARGREAVSGFWEYVAFIANSLIFMLIGLQEVYQEFRTILAAAVVAIVFVTLGRAAAIYPLCAIFSKTALRVAGKHQHVLFWGGLRGALALALAMGLPDATPMRQEIVTVAFAVVTFSIFVQGLTMIPLLRRIGEIPSASG